MAKYPETPEEIAISLDGEITTDIAEAVGARIGFDSTKYDIEQLRLGLIVELEHGTRDSSTNITDDDPIMTGKIAYIHIKEKPDYYTLLDKHVDPIDSTH